MKTYFRTLAAVIVIASTSLTVSAQSTQAMSGTNPRPQAMSGTNPRPQAMSGTNPRPQAMSGTNPRPQSILGGVYGAVLALFGF